MSSAPAVSAKLAIVCLTLFACTGLGMASPALAYEGSLRQKLFEMDKVAALADFDAGQKQACINAFRLRYPSQYTLHDSLAFNESLSLAAYDRLFWKGNGSSQRGLIFTGTVTDPSGAQAGNLLCYYAITDYRLDFQSAYVLPLRSKGATAASSGKSDIQASLISVSGER